MDASFKKKNAKMLKIHIKLKILGEEDSFHFLTDSSILRILKIFSITNDECSMLRIIVVRIITRDLVILVVSEI